MSEDNNYRHRFTVPKSDTVVNSWIENQSNLAFSLRVLIKDFVRNYGNRDATCIELGTEAKRRGRPPKELKEKLNKLDEGIGDFIETEDDSVASVEEVRQPEPEQLFSKETIQKKAQQVEAAVPATPRVERKTQPSERAVSTNDRAGIMNVFNKGTSGIAQGGELPMDSDGNIDFDALVSS